MFLQTTVGVKVSGNYYEAPLSRGLCDKLTKPQKSMYTLPSHTDQKKPMETFLPEKMLKKAMETVLFDANLKKKDIAEVLMVGGSSNNVQVQQFVATFLTGKQRYSHANFFPDKVVVCGAGQKVYNLFVSQLCHTMNILPVCLSICLYLSRK